MATEKTEDLPADADATISNRESEAADETGNVPAIDRDQSVKMSECVDGAYEARSVDGRPKTVHRRREYLADYCK